MKSGFKIVGSRQTELNLMQVSRGMAGQVVSASMSKGSTVINKGLKRRYRPLRDPETLPGQHLDESIGVGRVRGRSRMDPKFEVGAKRGTRGVHLVHLVENGTAPHYQPGLGIMHPGARPNPVMKQTFDADGPMAVDVILDDLEVQYRRLVGRLRTRSLTR